MLTNENEQNFTNSKNSLEVPGINPPLYPCPFFSKHHLPSSSVSVMVGMKFNHLLKDTKSSIILILGIFS